MAVCTIYDWTHMRRETWRDGKLAAVSSDPAKVMKRTPGWTGDLSAVTFDLDACVRMVGLARAAQIRESALAGQPLRLPDFTAKRGDLRALVARMEQVIYESAQA